MGWADTNKFGEARIAKRRSLGRIASEIRSCFGLPNAVPPWRRIVLDEGRPSAIRVMDLAGAKQRIKHFGIGEPKLSNQCSRGNFCRWGGLSFPFQPYVVFSQIPEPGSKTGAKLELNRYLILYFSSAAAYCRLLPNMQKSPIKPLFAPMVPGTIVTSDRKVTGSSPVGRATF
jgi:hypothetical protein